MILSYQRKDAKSQSLLSPDLCLENRINDFKNYFLWRFFKIFSECFASLNLCVYGSDFNLWFEGAQ